MTQWTESTFILRPSTAKGVNGIGVFTTHDIPKGTQVFSGKFNPRTMKIKDVPSEFVKFCIYLNDEECWVPERFDRIETGWYLNHSDTPNIAKNPPGKHGGYAIRDIKAGEEIFMDYNQLNEPEHLKESYYRKKK